MTQLYYVIRDSEDGRDVEEHTKETLLVLLNEISSDGGRLIFANSVPGSWGDDAMAMGVVDDLYEILIIKGEIVHPTTVETITEWGVG